MEDTQKKRSYRKSYAGIMSRHQKELVKFQEDCEHPTEVFRFSPWVVCGKCQKVLREVTKEERKRESDAFLKELSLGIDEALAERV